MRLESENRDLDLLLGEDRTARAGNDRAGKVNYDLVPKNTRLDSRTVRSTARSGSGAKKSSYGTNARTESYRRKQRRKKRRRQVMIARTVSGVVMIALAFGVVFGLWKIGKLIWEKAEPKDPVAAMQEEEDKEIIQENKSIKPEIREDFLTPNEFSRPGEELPEVTELFVHYTANKGTSAAQNRSYFENLGITGETSASAHFVIGYDGEIIQCLPLDEIGYAVKEHNYNSISIECCYLDDDGKFTDATYQSLIKLLGWLMNEYQLGPSAVQRHYDTCGKLCPRYYVEHEDAWEQLKADLTAYIS